jgi:hypothetical protein
LRLEEDAEGDAEGGTVRWWELTYSYTTWQQEQDNDRGYEL